MLHLCAEGPTYGNQLMERIGDLTAGTVAVNPNTMYPLLRTLEADGFIAGEWEHPERRSRRFYRITPAGRGRARRAWRAEVGPRLDAIAHGIERIREELRAPDGQRPRARDARSAGLDLGRAEALWYDQRRWPSFIEGFAHVVGAEGEWPRRGAQVDWDSVRAGRGRVVERVVAYEPRMGQTVAGRRPQAAAARSASPSRRARAATIEVSLELEYELKSPGLRGPGGRPAVRPPRARRLAAPHARALRPASSRRPEREMTR